MSGTKTISRVVQYGLYSSGLRYRPMIGPYVHGNELLGRTKGEFLN
jgi:hypothetical protein